MASSHSPDAATEQLVASVSGKPGAMVMLARTLLLPRGDTVRALSLCDEALSLAPGDAEVRALAQGIRARCVGSWYFTMVRDHGRHDLYAQAFRKIFKPGCTVLDIGAGTGLFAMLAAREGAGRVIACERDPAVAEAARQVIEDNGYSDRVTVVAKDSRGLQPGVDLDGLADVLLWDNLSNDLISAGAADAIEDARRRLLKPGGAIIPARAEVRVGLVDAAAECGLEMSDVDGFDLTAFNRFRPSQTTLSRSKSERRSESVTIFDFDFNREGVLKEGRGTTAIHATGGRVLGIAQWLRFHLADGIEYDTGDGEGVTAFGLQYHAVEPFYAEPGQAITIDGAHDRHGMWFWINEIPTRARK